ncbi:myb-related transcription factor, partner of profilin-like [Chanodichthys erythropterus]|uniref:myb-related transcription factor, partner of profilin-like n=1 Tax=Chanodichthys erythropterus TaxID=933992 RepID=UPI00351F3467
MAEFVGGKAERFSSEETDLLVREVKAREQIIYGTSRNPPKLPEVKKAWDELAVIVSSSSGIRRTALQCRKKYNDVRRRGKQKLAANKKQQVATGGGPHTPTTDLTPVEDIAASTLNAESIEGFGGLEVRIQAPLAEDCVAGPSRQEEGAVSDGEETVEQPSSLRGEARLPRARLENVRHEDHPFLKLQQDGFNMLERVMGTLNQSMRQVNTRLSHLEMLLLPLGRIADSVGRLADAVERITPATSPAITPPSTGSSLSTRSMSTLRSAPLSSRRPSRRGGSHLRGRRGKI